MNEYGNINEEDIFALISNFDIDQLANNIDDIQFENEQVRLKSFSYWMIPDVCKEKLACAGFHHVKEDHVKCFQCNVVIGNWCRGDHPFIEHYKHSSECAFIKGETTNNVPINLELLQREISELMTNTEKYQKDAYVHNKPCSENKILHPNYKTIDQRIKTFENWPRGLNQTPEELSKAGFFYLGTSDEVKCFCCGKCLKGWERDDKPHAEHKRHFGTICKFIRDVYSECENKGKNKTTSKASAQQINYLKDYMKNHSDLANGVINISNNKEEFTSMWDNLTETLNERGPAKKESKSWREVWRNVKYNSRKASKRLAADPIMDLRYESNTIIENSLQLQAVGANQQPNSAINDYTFPITVTASNVFSNNSVTVPIDYNNYLSNSFSGYSTQDNQVLTINPENNLKIRLLDSNLQKVQQYCNQQEQGSSEAELRQLQLKKDIITLEVNKKKLELQEQHIKLERSKQFGSNL